MFAIESYLTPALLDYLDKYVSDFNPADAQVSLWSGDVGLHNLVLKPDVLQRELGLPFVLSSGRIHELLIHVPWLKIGSEPIVVTINTIECVVKKKDSTDTAADRVDTQPSAPAQQAPEVPPGYVAALMQRVVSNVAIRINHLIIKYVEEDMVLSLNVEQFTADSADSQWRPAFADVDPVELTERKLLRLTDLTLCLDQRNAAGVIEVYQEPLLYRCNLDFRVQSKLAQVSSRRATHIRVDLHSERLDLNVADQQIPMLCRLETFLREFRNSERQSSPVNTTQRGSVQLSRMEEASAMSIGAAIDGTDRVVGGRQASWSEWAWSWVPAWSSAPGLEAAAPPIERSLFFYLKIDRTSFTFKVTETESGSRPRPRNILRLVLQGTEMAVTSHGPKLLNILARIPSLELMAKGACVCGAPTIDRAIYVKSLGVVTSSATVLESELETKKSEPTEECTEGSRQAGDAVAFRYKKEVSVPEDVNITHFNGDFEYSNFPEVCENETWLGSIEVTLCAGLIHRLTALMQAATTSYDTTKQTSAPTSSRRRSSLPPLTMEENDFLHDNLPLKITRLEWLRPHIRFVFWDHPPPNIRGAAVTDWMASHGQLPTLVLETASGITVTVSEPLYPQRVAAAACQMSHGPVRRAAHRRIALDLPSLRLNLVPTTGLPGTAEPTPAPSLHSEVAAEEGAVTEQSAPDTPDPAESTEEHESATGASGGRGGVPVARFEARFNTTMLILPELYESSEPVLISYNLKFKEVALCGSAPRLQAAFMVMTGVCISEPPDPARHPLYCTTLPTDAINDREAVHLDAVVEDLVIRWYNTNNTHTHILVLQEVRATLIETVPDTDEIQQAWIFSAPDSASTGPYLRLAVQYTERRTPGGLDYMGVWSEPASACLDPLLAGLLAYEPRPLRASEKTAQPAGGVFSTASSSGLDMRSFPSAPYLHRRSTPTDLSYAPPLSGRPQSQRHSVTDRTRVSDLTIQQLGTPSTKWRPYALYTTLKRLCMCAEIGLTTMYIPNDTVSAVDCPSLYEAIERHVAKANSKRPEVLVVSLGKISAYSNTSKKQLWQLVHHDGPTILNEADYHLLKANSFPWSLHLTDMSAYTVSRKWDIDNTARRSPLKQSMLNQVVVELVTTGVTLSAVMEKKDKPPPSWRSKEVPKDEDTEKMDYFTSGTSFQPKNLREFVHGPSWKEDKARNTSIVSNKEEEPPPELGKLMGACLHIDTTPLCVELRHDQILVVGNAIHSISHILERFSAAPASTQSPPPPAPTLADALSSASSEWLRVTPEALSGGGLATSASEELIPIFERCDSELKVSLWLQWVVNRVRVRWRDGAARLVLEVEDVSASADLQPDYTQYKVKLADMSLHHERRNMEQQWVPGELGGSILRARNEAETTKSKGLLAVTITTVKKSSLALKVPDEANLGKRQRKRDSAFLNLEDVVWEVAVRAAPLDAVLSPTVLSRFAHAASPLVNAATCAQARKPVRPVATLSRPRLYVEWGGAHVLLPARALVAGTDALHDVLIVEIRRVSVDPMPDNPIERRPVRAELWSDGASSTCVDYSEADRQYRINIHSLALHTARWSQLEEASAVAVVASENPARAWSVRGAPTAVTPLVRGVVVTAIVAPSVWARGTLVCPPAAELDLPKPVMLHLCSPQIQLVRALMDELVVRQRRRTHLELDTTCPYRLARMFDASTQFQSLPRQDSVRLFKRSIPKSVSITWADHDVVEEEEEVQWKDICVTAGVVEIILYEWQAGSNDENYGHLAILHARLDQPNMSISRGRDHDNCQVSLYDLKVKCGRDVPDAKTTDTPRASVATDGSDSVPPGFLSPAPAALPDPDDCPLILLDTARGAVNPTTEIPPALLTLRTNKTASGSTKIKVMFERPLRLQICEERCRRIHQVMGLANESKPAEQGTSNSSTQPTGLWQLKKLLESTDGVEVTTTQLISRLAEDSGLSFGIGGVTAKLAVPSARPDRLVLRALVRSLALSAPCHLDNESERMYLLHPLSLGVEGTMAWEAWRRAETTPGESECSSHLLLEAGIITSEATPHHLDALLHTAQRLKMMADIFADASKGMVEGSDSDSGSSEELEMPVKQETHATYKEQYYMDDLGNGTFKVAAGGQLPVAYQVLLSEGAVTWRYPHPRAISRLLAFPLPYLQGGQCVVLEWYCEVQQEFQPLAYLELSELDTAELNLPASPQTSCWAAVWRVRTCQSAERATPISTRTFDPSLYKPQTTRQTETPSEYRLATYDADEQYKESITSDTLASVLRVDSYFAPRAVPRASASVRLTGIHVRLHSLSKASKRSAPVMTLRTDAVSLHARLAPAGATFAAELKLALDIVDPSTLELQRVAGSVDMRVGCWARTAGGGRMRAHVGPLRASFAPHHLHALRMMQAQWMKIPTQMQGRCMRYVIHNTMDIVIRIGQEGTDESVPLEPGAELAYVWRSPGAPRRLKLSCADGDWHWSPSFQIDTAGRTHVSLDSQYYGAGMRVHICVQLGDAGRRNVIIEGRIHLANMLLFAFQYKMRMCGRGATTFVRTATLPPETDTHTLMCNSADDIAIKLKLAHLESGWTGEIPLKECPKSNAPWLVKVPCADQMEYISIWCRVVKQRESDRVLVMFWPLYFITSYLPLDVDATIASEGREQAVALAVSGRGATAQLYLPCTTATKHSLTFQYRDIQTLVTQTAVPLHYALTEKNIFESKGPAKDFDAISADLRKWLAGTSFGQDSEWPYSCVAEHWGGVWRPALLPPHTDIAVYYRGVAAGAGGCALSLLLSPRALLCNASPLSVTLRANDFTHLCKVEPGCVTAPPSSFLKGSFFISLEVGRNTWVSEELRVRQSELGAYEKPASGELMYGHPASIAIACNDRVALLSVYYEMTRDMAVFGLSATYVIRNRLQRELFVAPLAFGYTDEDEKNNRDVLLHPRVYKPVPSEADDSECGVALGKFWLADTGEKTHLRLFVCLALPGATGEHYVPLRIDVGLPIRRTVALRTPDGSFISCCVCVVRSDGRTLIEVSPEPRPQMLVRNRTQHHLLIAAPKHVEQVESERPLEVEVECCGARWYTRLPPYANLPYSTPTYCAKLAKASAEPAPEFQPPAEITIALLETDGPLVPNCIEWSVVVSLEEGDCARLLKLARGELVKVAVRKRLWDFLITVDDVAQHEVSASDIRQRLLVGGPSSCSLQSTEASDEEKLQRHGANNALLDAADVSNARSSLSLAAISKVILEPSTPLPSTSYIQHGGRVGNRQSHQRIQQRVSFQAARPASDDDGRADYLELVKRSEYDDSWSCSVACAGAAIELAATVGSISVPDGGPLLVLHMQRLHLAADTNTHGANVCVSVREFQLDNAQHAHGTYDFPVVLVGVQPAEWTAEHTLPPLWSALAAERYAGDACRLWASLALQSWTDKKRKFMELCGIEVRAGELAVYVEDRYIAALLAYLSELTPLPPPPPPTTPAAIATNPVRISAELAQRSADLREPLRLRLLRIHSLPLLLSLHTSVWLYIALDHSPLEVAMFERRDVATTSKKLGHALAMHYLSGAIFGAGWLLSGLEALGAPGTLARRVVTGVRALADGGGPTALCGSVTAGALQSLAALCGSLARNLDLLAGDEEHAKRAAAQRRKRPSTLASAVATGLEGLAVGLLGGVGGLAHHPLMGATHEGIVGGLRRGIVGVVAKPLSATADLLALSSHGLLSQAGWELLPQAQPLSQMERTDGWDRDCARWHHRLEVMRALHACLVDTPRVRLLLLLTPKWLMLVDPDTDNILESVDLKACSLAPTVADHIVHVQVAQKTPHRLQSEVVLGETNIDHDEQDQEARAAALSRVARFTGAAPTPAHRVLQFRLTTPHAQQLRATLDTLVNSAANTFFEML